VNQGGRVARDCERSGWQMHHEVTDLRFTLLVISQERKAKPRRSGPRLQDGHLDAVELTHLDGADLMILPGEEQSSDRCTECFPNRLNLVSGGGNIVVLLPSQQYGDIPLRRASQRDHARQCRKSSVCLEDRMAHRCHQLTMAPVQGA